MPDSGAKSASWLLLVHNVPAEPLYLRAKVRRLLDHAGAITLKKSVYALPPREGCREALDEAAREARAGGGHGYVAECKFLDAGTDGVLIEGSRSARRAER